MEWNEPLYSVGSGENGRVGVLVLHGFTGSPRSVQEWALRLVDDGYTVALPLLAGHGLTPHALASVRRTDWTADAERGLGWLAERTDYVFLAGLSMGGSLAIWLAERHVEAAGLITVNALLRHPQERAMRVLGRIGLPRWVKPVGNDIHAPGADECAYERIPSRSAHQLALLLAAVRRDLPRVRCPALIFASREDHVVPPANQHELYAGIGSADKKMIELDKSYHVATMDYEKELIFAETLKFVAAVSATRRDARSRLSAPALPLPATPG